MLGRLGFLLLALLLAGCQGEKKIDWVSSESPKATNVLKVSYIEGWGFGPQRIVFSDTKKELVTKELRNDGKNLSDHNIELEWLDEKSVRVTLKGEEQKDETFVLSPAKIQP